MASAMLATFSRARCISSQLDRSALLRLGRAGAATKREQRGRAYSAWTDRGRLQVPADAAGGPPSLPTLPSQIGPVYRYINARTRLAHAQFARIWTLTYTDVYVAYVHIHVTLTEIHSTHQEFRRAARRWRRQRSAGASPRALLCIFPLSSSTVFFDAPVPLPLLPSPPPLPPPPRPTAVLVSRVLSFVPLARHVHFTLGPRARLFNDHYSPHAHAPLIVSLLSLLDFARFPRDDDNYQITSHSRAHSTLLHCAFAAANDCDSGRPTPYKRAYPTERYYDESGRPSRTTTRSPAWNPPPPPVPPSRFAALLPVPSRAANPLHTPACKQRFPHPAVLLVDLRPGTNDRVPSSRSSASEGRKKMTGAFVYGTSSVTGET